MLKDHRVAEFPLTLNGVQVDSRYNGGLPLASSENLQSDMKAERAWPISLFIERGGLTAYPCHERKKKNVKIPG